MIIRKHANKTYSEFNKIITSKAKTVGNYGINWICNNKHRIILYYESGETDSRGLLQLLKSYFLGYYRVKKWCYNDNGNNNKRTNCFRLYGFCFII